MQKDDTPMITIDFASGDQKTQDKSQAYYDAENQELVDSDDEDH